MSIKRTSWKRIKKNAPGKYRSKFEYNTAENLRVRGVKFEYESIKIKYIRPASPRTYTPDFLLPNGIIVETKGRFTSADRMKHLWIRDEHPDIDIRFVFMNSNNTLNRSSTTTYADWCKAKGFKYADKEVPKEWIKEKSKMKNLISILKNM